MAEKQNTPADRAKGQAAILGYQKRSSSGLFTSTLALPNGAFKRAAFMPGCSLASYSPHLVALVHAFLQSRMPGIGLLQQCCAKPAHSLDDSGIFKHYYGKLQQELEHHGLDTVITACENCYVTLQATSPGLTVRTLYEVLAETGIPARDYSAMPPAALHDPCPTRKETALHDSVRELLTRMRYPFEEFALNRERTICCGSGNMLELTNPERALAMMRKRCGQTSHAVLISYCQTCVEAFNKGGKRGVHLLDLIFNENMRPDFAQPRQGFLRRWVNRYRAKRLACNRGNYKGGENS